MSEPALSSVAAASAGTTPTPTGLQDHSSGLLADLLAKVAEDSRLLTEMAGQEAERIRALAEAELERAREQAAAILASAHQEAERDRSSAASCRAESQRLLDDSRQQSTRIMNEAQEDCNRLIGAARAAAEAEVDGIRREFRSHLVAVRDALGEVCETLGRFVDPEPGSEQPD